jgi:hypothetical protein
MRVAASRPIISGSTAADAEEEAIARPDAFGVTATHPPGQRDRVSRETVRSAGDTAADDTRSARSDRTN